MNRHHSILLLLLAGSLLWAYLLSHPADGGSGPSGGGVTLWDIPAREISRLTYRDGTTEVVLEPQWDTSGDLPFIWISAKLPRPGPPAKKGAAPPPQPPPEQIAFKGNDNALKSIRFFAAATATRVIGARDVLDLSTFGLPTENHTLEVRRGQHGPPLRLELGRTTYGSGGQYALSSRDDRLYLMKAGEFRKLARSRGSMMDRELLPFPPAEAGRIRLKMGALEKSLWRLDNANQWSGNREDSRPDEHAAAFINTLGRLKVARYAPAELAEAGENTAPLLELNLFRGGEPEPAAVLRMVRNGEDFLVRSSYTRKWVSVSRHLGKRLADEGRQNFQGS